MTSTTTDVTWPIARVWWPRWLTAAHLPPLHLPPAGTSCPLAVQRFRDVCACAPIKSQGSILYQLYDDCPTRLHPLEMELDELLVDYFFSGRSYELILQRLRIVNGIYRRYGFQCTLEKSCSNIIISVEAGLSAD